MLTLKEPESVHLDANDRPVAADGGNQRVLEFDPQLRRARQFGTGQAGSGKGPFLRAFGKKGTGAGEFKTPRNVTLGENGHVIVRERRNHRLQVLDLDGNTLAVFRRQARGSPGGGCALRLPIGRRCASNRVRAAPRREREARQLNKGR